MSKGKFLKVGQIRVSEDGNYYLKVLMPKNKEGQTVLSNLTLTDGQSLWLQKPQDEIISLQTRGIITEEQANQRLAALDEKASFVKYNVILPPSK